MSGRQSKRARVAIFTNELARMIRTNDRPVAQGHTTTGSDLLFTVYDGVGINIVITAARGVHDGKDPQ